MAVLIAMMPLNFVKGDHPEERRDEAFDTVSTVGGTLVETDASVEKTVQWCGGDHHGLGFS